MNPPDFCVPSNLSDPDRYLPETARRQIVPVLPDDPAYPESRVPLHVVLDNLRSAYNVGSIFRTADACRAAHLWLCGMTAHPPHPKLEKTALGAEHAIRWSYFERNRDCVARLKELDIPIVALEVLPSAVPYHQFDWPRPVALVVGNEDRGVHERVLRHCDAVVCIPMLGIKNSLNVATAFGIAAYGILQQWGLLSLSEPAARLPLQSP